MDMSVDQTNVVDAIGLDNQSGELVLTISDHLVWGDAKSEHFFLLQEKLNKYLSFVEGGEILEAYPDAAGRKVVIDVVCKYQVNDVASIFFSKAKAIIDMAGMELRYRHFVSKP